MKIAIALCLFGLLLIVIFAIYRIIKWYGVRYLANEKQYEADYRLIKLLLDKNEINKVWFEKIDLRIANLKRLPFKNKEKTEILCNDFYKKYAKVRVEKYLLK